jgi:N-acetylglucosamine-6-sulfatase
MTRRGRAVAGLAAVVALAGLGWSSSPGPDATGAAPDTTSGAAPSSPGESSPGEAPPAPGFPIGNVLPGTQVRPNIVVIMADDMRADEIRFMPHVRRLIGAAGVTFDNSFSPYPLCCPARASFLSGQYTHNHGVWSNYAPYGFPAFDDRRTLATQLDAAGYNTGFIGKYLNGYGSKPPRGSADGNSLRYVPPGWDDWQAGVIGPRGWDAPEAGGVYRYWDMTLNVNGTLQGHAGQYQTRMLGARTEDLIGRYARSPRPFFLWTSYVAPHIGSPREPDDPKPVTRKSGLETKFRTPARPRDVRGMFDDVITAAPGAEGESDVTGKPFFVRDLPQPNQEEQAGLLELARQRAEAVHVLDQQVARTMDALAASGELENTLVVFTSDNGFFLGEHRIRMGKLLPYEPSLRVPTMMRGPGVPAGETRDAPFLTVDYAPTFLEAAGLPRDPRMDGLSRLGVAREEGRGWVRPVFTESGPLPKSVLTRDDMALLDRRRGPSDLRFAQGVRTPRYLYVEYASKEKELYDLETDPAELTNLVGDPDQARNVRRLARLLDGMRDCRGAACAAPMPKAFQDRTG